MHHLLTDDLQHSEFYHRSKTKDQLVCLLFPLVKFKFSQTLHVGTIRLYTCSYSKGRMADDLNIISVLSDIDYPDRIRSVFTINDGEPHLLVAYITSLTPFTFEIDEKVTLSMLIFVR